MKKLILTLPALLIFIGIIGQVPGIKWTKYIRPSQATSEGIFESQRTEDGGYIVAGIDTAFDYSRSQLIYNKYMQGRAWIAKLDSNGSTIWSRKPSTVDPHSSGFLSVCRTASNLNVAAGHGNITFPYNSNFYIAAYNDAGVFQWDTLYGGSGVERALTIQETLDGGYIIAGYTTSDDGQVSGNHNLGTTDAWVVKINAARAIQWQKCYGGSAGDTAYSILQTTDGGYIMAGVSSSSNGDLTGNNGLTDAWIFKTDNLGNIQWQRNIGGTGDEALKSIVSNSDGTYTLTGYTRSSSVLSNGLKGQSDLWIITVSGNDGSTIWSKGFGGSADDHGYSIKRTVGNGFLVGGFTESTDGDVTGQSGRSDAWLLNLQNNGTLNWRKAIGTSKDEFAFTAHSSYGSDYAITGIATPVTPQSIYDSTDGYAVLLGNINTIKGILFYDANTNGIKDPGEQNFTQADVKTVSGSFERISIPSAEGFSTIVDLGTYTTSVVLHHAYYTVTPASRVSTFSTYLNTDSFSFAVQPIPGIQDLVINAIPLTPARPGFSLSYKIFYKNLGTTTIPSGQVLFKKDPRLNFVSAVPSISSVNGDTLKWNYSNLQPLDVASITVNFTVSSPPTVNIGDTLTSIGIITPVAGDQTPNDDTVIIKQIVIGSFDPNDKYEKNEGRITSEYIGSGDYLDYLVRFQNLGTDTAFNIEVLDTLSAKLDLSTLQVIAVSHSYKVNLTGNILKWTFSDINLPHSAVNEPASHGYIAYRIKPLTSVAIGDTINNTASIYFDFNLPVRTNNAFTLVQDDVALPLDLLSFSGVYYNDQATLHWTTANESNIERFEVQRSFNGTDFISIGHRLPAGNINSLTQYDFTDDLNSVSASTLFYRLFIRERDGKVNYSRILVFQKRNQTTNSISISPNPVTGVPVVSINYSKQDLVELRVIDGSGKIVLKQQHFISKGNNSILVKGIGNLRPGYYIMQALATDDRLIVPFIVK